VAVSEYNSDLKSQILILMSELWLAIAPQLRNQQELQEKVFSLLKQNVMSKQPQVKIISFICVSRLLKEFARVYNSFAP